MHSPDSAAARRSPSRVLLRMRRGPGLPSRDAPCFLPLGSKGRKGGGSLGCSTWMAGSCHRTAQTCQGVGRRSGGNQRELQAPACSFAGCLGCTDILWWLLFLSLQSWRIQQLPPEETLQQSGLAALGNSSQGRMAWNSVLGREAPAGPSGGQGASLLLWGSKAEGQAWRLNGQISEDHCCCHVGVLGSGFQVLGLAF